MKENYKELLSLFGKSMVYGAACMTGMHIADSICIKIKNKLETRKIKRRFKKSK